MERNKREDGFVIVLGIVLAYFLYSVVMNQLPDIMTDFNGHTYVYLPMLTQKSWVEGWMAVPYCMWHLCVLALKQILRIPLEVSVAYVSCFFYLLAYWLMYWMLQKYMAAKGEALSSVKAGLIAFGLSVVQALYFFWLDTGARFLGTFSMNPIHNPTHICVRPFVLLCFCLVCDIRGRQKDENYRGIFFRVENGLKKYYIYLAVVLLLSTMAKPVFAEMFIPAVGVMMLVEWIACILRKDGSAGIYFKQCLTMLLCAAPALVYILVQFLAYFIFGGSYGADGSLMLTKWMEVWQMYSENVTLSILLGMAFPLYMILIDSRFFFKSDMGRLALAGYAVGLLEAAILGEGGSKMNFANFLWPMMCGMQLVWVVSALRLVELERNQADTKTKRFLLDFAWVLFCLHVLCGLLYIKEIIGA